MKYKSNKNKFLDKIRKLSKTELDELLSDKRLELMKFELAARGYYGGTNNRMAYTDKTKFNLRNIRKQIAQIKTIIKEQRS